MGQYLRKQSQLAGVTIRTIEIEMPFVLEVVRFIQDRAEWTKKGAKMEHVGYMRVHFRTKKNTVSGAVVERKKAQNNQ